MVNSFLVIKCCVFILSICYLQESLKSTLETTVVPAFQISCKTMFEQMDSTIKKGIIEHTAAALQHFDSQHTAVALALRV